jgi:uncharacterized protein (DUF983 family)
MTFRQRARLIMIAAWGVAVILGWVVARTTDQPFWTVMMVLGLIVVAVGLVLDLVGKQRSRKSRR